MSVSGLVFCAACQRRNEGDATTCVFCGAPLMKPIRGFKTTEEVSAAYISSKEREMPCEKYLPKVPEGTFALFVMGDDNPILVRDFETLDLGRMTKDTETPHLDFSAYGALGQGISRLHARITYDKGVYKINDMDSTNGTWLNQQRLTPGKSYLLHNGDTIMLGRLRLTICYHEIASRKLSHVQLSHIETPGTTPLQILTPHLLETTIASYLQAIIELSHISHACRGLEKEDVSIRSLTSAAQRSHLHVELEGAGEAIDLIRKWVLPWRQAQTVRVSPEEWSADTLFQAELELLSKKILIDISPDLDDGTLTTLGKQLEPHLLILLTSNLELIESA